MVLIAFGVYFLFACVCLYNLEKLGGRIERLNSEMDEFDRRWGPK